MILGKNLKFHRVCLFFEKDLDMYFKDVPIYKNGFLHDKNVI